MEYPLGPRKPPLQRRARSLDRSQNPGKDSELWDNPRLSLPATHSGREPVGKASDGSRRLKSPGSSEAPGTTGAALRPEGTRELLPSEQRPLQDTKKDKTQSRAQQGLLKTVLNFFLRTGPEETKEKARRAKGKEGLPQPSETSEWPGQPAPRKKAHDKKASRKKRGHKKHVDEETRGAQEQEAKGQEAALPRTAAALRSEEADLGPGRRGGEDADLHQSLLTEGPDAGVPASGQQQEEELTDPDQDIIPMIVRLLQKVGDQWDEEVRDLTQFLSSPSQQLQASQPEMAPQNPAPASRKKSQEKKCNLKRTCAHKKHGSEEPKRAGAADGSSPESRLPKRPSFLYLCVRGHQPSISSSLDLEEPEVQETPSADCGYPSPFELSTQAGTRGPGEDLQPGRALERREFIQKIIALLQDGEEQEGEKQLEGQEPEMAVENLAPPSRKKSQEKKSSFRKAFSHKKHRSKEPKRAGGAGVASPESRPPRRPSYLSLCVGGHRSSISSSLDPESIEFQESSPAEEARVGSSESPSQARSHRPEGRPLPDGACESKELIIQKLAVLLQQMDGHLGRQIRRHPSFKSAFYQLPESSLVKLVAILRSQAAHAPEPHRNLPERPYQYPFGLANRFPGNNRHTALSLMRLRYPQFPCAEAQQDIPSSEAQSPD
ncbi:protein BNIP5 [Molossus molossus]|uniref:BCL2 interacting protein 5 n=1 Tax=Molossus molossus TaxID=27622 RepID=A0A7J8GNN6_MOLMO|nr:protein BNIP5 [Molossus molossus]KAF6461527.1 hypothetical protein HJG59_001918 [Molossus molossus]